MGIAKKGLWGIIGGLCLCVIILLFLLLMNIRANKSIQTQLPGAEDLVDSNKIIAQIGDVQITLGELQEDLVRSYGTEMLNQLLNNHAIRIEAKQLGISVTTDEIEKEIKAMSSGYDDINQYYKAMQEQLGLTKEDLYKDAEYKLLLEIIATRGITISERQIDEYLRLHKNEFKPKREFHLQQMVLATEEIAEKALKEIAKGESFAVIVRDRSIDDASSVNGGDLGWVVDDDPFVPAQIFEEAAKLQTGKTSGIIKLDNGNYTIIKLLDQKSEKQENPAITRTKVRKQLELQNALPMKEVVQELRKKHGAIIYDNQLLI